MFWIYLNFSNSNWLSCLGGLPVWSPKKAQKTSENGGGGGDLVHNLNKGWLSVQNVMKGGIGIE